MATKLLRIILFIFLFLTTASGCYPLTTPPPQNSSNFPSKPINLIVAFGMGGADDLHAHALEKLTLKYLNQPFAIINKPGGCGTIGFDEVATATPNGYTLGISNLNMLLQPLYEPSKYHYTLTLDPIAQITTSPYIMIVNEDSPWHSIYDLIDFAKQHPQSLKLGNSGTGSLPHIIGLTFAKNANINIEQVPFRGGGQVIKALLGNHIQIAFANAGVTKKHILSGKLRPLATTGEKRLSDPTLNNIPTLKELGFDTVITNWYGIVAPKNLPPDVKNKLENSLKALILDPEFRVSIESLGFELNYLDAIESRKHWLEESTKLSKLLNENGLLDEIKTQKNR